MAAYLPLGAEIDSLEEDSRNSLLFPDSILQLHFNFFLKKKKRFLVTFQLDHLGCLMLTRK